MKKLVKMAGALFALILMLNLAACGGSDNSDSPYVGLWKATSAEMSGISVSVDTVLGGDLTFDLKGNGTCTLDIAGDSENGKWEETSDGFEIEGEFTVVVDGDTGTMDYEGLIINFEKQ